MKKIDSDSFARIGICCDFEKYDAVREMGYEFIEMFGTQVIEMSSQELREAGKKITGSGMPCIGLCSYCDERLPMAGEGYNAAAAKEYAKRMCERAVRLGAGQIGIGSPKARRIKPDFSYEDAYRQMTEFVRVTAEIASGYGIYILLEALNRDIADMILETTTAVDMVKEIKLTNVAVVLDFHHMTVMGEPLKELYRHIPYIRHLHINRVGKDGKDKRFLQPEGIPVYQAQADAVYSYGYRGAISLEAFNTNDFLVDAEQSYLILKEILKPYAEI